MKSISNKSLYGIIQSIRYIAETSWSDAVMGEMLRQANLVNYYVVDGEKFFEMDDMDYLKDRLFLLEMQWLCNCIDMQGVCDVIEDICIRFRAKYISKMHQLTIKKRLLHGGDAGILDLLPEDIKFEISSHLCHLFSLFHVKRRLKLNK